MRRALVFQHMDHDTPGRFAEFMAADGLVPRSVRLWEGEAIPPLDGFDLMFVLGGAQDVWEEHKYPWLAAEKEAIREWVARRAKPYLGLCLGHQLLVSALGGEVGPARRGEVGVFTVAATPEGATHPLFAGVGPEQRVMQWHFAEVKRAPRDATVLATSAEIAIQAVAVGEHALGLQFHAEISAQTMTSWASLPSYISALERRLGPGSYERLTAEAFPLMPGMEAAARQLYSNLMNGTAARRAA